MKRDNVLVLTLIAAIISLLIIVIIYPQLRNRPIITSNQLTKIISPSDSKQEDLLLPDISIETPKELYISRSGDKKFIRFSTTFINRGNGALELIGHHDETSQKTFATQYIKRNDGTGKYQEIGEFVFHPTHRHWHVGKYVLYQLWTINQGQKDKIVANTGKQSFCIWDEHLGDSSLNGVRKSRFYTSNCNQNTQGLSVGWGDTYKSSIDGQNIEITGIPDGEYFFISEVNPERKIIESNFSNNQDLIKLRITGNKLTILK